MTCNLKSVFALAGLSLLTGCAGLQNQPGGTASSGPAATDTVFVRDKAWQEKFADTPLGLTAAERNFLKYKSWHRANAASAEPAPERSLYTPGLNQALRDVMAGKDTVFLAEVHDSTNHKFLADNPEIFRAAAARGGRYMFLELDVIHTQSFRTFFDGRITAGQLHDMIKQQWGYLDQKPTSGDSAEEWATRLTAMCRTARAEHIEIVPFQFVRDMDRFARFDPGTGLMPKETYMYSTDVFGIRDITERYDTIYRQTLLSLKAYKKLTGKALPMTVADFDRFRDLHARRMLALPIDEKRDAVHDVIMRMAPFYADYKYNGMNYQDPLDARLIGRMTRPGEFILLMTGRSHFARLGGLRDLFVNAGRKAGGFLMLSDPGLLEDRRERAFGLLAMDEIAYPLDFAVLTERQTILPVDAPVLTEINIGTERMNPDEYLDYHHQVSGYRSVVQKPATFLPAAP